MEPIFLKNNFSKGLFLKYKYTIESNTKGCALNKMNIKSVTILIFTVEVKEVDELENKTLEIALISAELYLDGEKIPCHEYDNIPLITMKLNKKDELIEMNYPTDYSFSLYPEEPKKINDEWTIVDKPFPKKSKNCNEAIEKVKNYIFSDLIKYKGIDVAVLKFTCPEICEKIEDNLNLNLYMKISTIGKELFDYKNGILVKSEINSKGKQFYGDSLKEMLENNTTIILELINDS